MASRLRPPFPQSTPARAFLPPTTGISGLAEELRAVAATVAERASGGVLQADLTRPGFGVPVVQVVTPGLRIVEDYR
ncbi:YcaO-like family protein [Streptomyces sp. NPDC006872]|uniref:YcaO-like family protein n=1 Tax=Streptomyces sp. NPDC006872 TaxID=3155720 RepID=UPI0033E40C8A